MHQETITKSTSYPVHGGYGSGYIPKSPSEKYPSLNNNLSELDTLLQDLSNSRFNETYVNTQETNGTGGYMNVRPGSAGSTLNRPTVDSLLEELDGPNG